MYNTILVPTDLAHDDLTIQSLMKADFLLDDGRIVLFHALDAIPSFALIELPDGIIERQIPDARDKLQQLIDKSGVKADIEIRKGSAANNIIEEAKVIGADLIVINSHQPGLQDYLLGSTAAKVVRHAHCAVLVDRHK